MAAAMFNIGPVCVCEPFATCLMEFDRRACDALLGGLLSPTLFVSYRYRPASIVLLGASGATIANAVSPDQLAFLASR